MDKQAKREALILYARQGHPTETDLWPGIQEELKAGRPAPSLSPVRAKGNTQD